MKPIIKVPLKFGGIGVAILVLMFFVFLTTDSNPLIEMKVFDFFILPVFLFFGIKEFRDTYNNKKLDYWQGMTNGLIIYGCIAIGYSLFLWIALQYTDSTLLTVYIDKSIEILQEDKVKLLNDSTEALYHQTIEHTKHIQQIDLVWDSLLKKIGIGFLLTSFLSIILKRKISTKI